MKRFHVHVAVAHLEDSIRFYPMFSEDMRAAAAPGASRLPLQEVERPQGTTACCVPWSEGNVAG